MWKMRKSRRKVSKVKKKLPKKSAEEMRSAAHDLSEKTVNDTLSLSLSELKYVKSALIHGIKKYSHPKERPPRIIDKIKRAQPFEVYEFMVTPFFQKVHGRLMRAKPEQTMENILYFLKRKKAEVEA